MAASVPPYAMAWHLLDDIVVQFDLENIEVPRINWELLEVVDDDLEYVEVPYLI